MDIETIKKYFIDLQQRICNMLEELDGKATFFSEKWDREEGGGGDTRVIADGNIFEKGGVNFSHVFGNMPEILKLESKETHFFQATGVSIVIHTQNPYVPIIHMNVRYFCTQKNVDSSILEEWFGGGIDVSPAYPNSEDCVFIHQYLKEVCDKFDVTYYPKYKKWCDDYFTIQHRREMRGVSGLFFDHLKPKTEVEKEHLFSFIQAIGNTFIPIYTELVNRNKEKIFLPKHKEWQYIRRGRYAEFNLVYDRGTHFGLQTNGRVESILMSLPPHAEWKYNYTPKEDSEEAQTLTFFQPKNWV